MEEEFIKNQEALKPKEDKEQEERSKVDDLRGTPMGVGTLEELIDDNHAIVSSSVGPEYYVSVLSFVNRDLLEPGCSVLLHNKVVPDVDCPQPRNILTKPYLFLRVLTGDVGSRHSFRRYGPYGERHEGR